MQLIDRNKFLQCKAVCGEGSKAKVTIICGIGLDFTVLLRGHTVTIVVGPHALGCKRCY
jgi:hypothetical protein